MRAIAVAILLSLDQVSASHAQPNEPDNTKPPGSQTDPNAKAADVNAKATDPDATAKAAEHYNRGKRHYDLAEYAQAITSWREAYRLAGEPLLLFNIAQAYRLAGDCAQANRFYSTYKQILAKPPNQTELEAAMQRCARVAPASGDSTAQPLVSTPWQGEPAPPSPPESPPRSPLWIIGVTGMGIGVVAGIGAAAFAISAHQQANTISGQANGTEWTPELANTELDGRTAETRAWVLTGVGAVALAAGGALWWSGRNRSSASINATISVNRVGVSLSCAF